MATATAWTPRSLGETLWALRRLTTLAPRAQLPEASQGYWDQVQQWLSDVEPLLRQAAEGGALRADIPPFPLTSPQLRELQRSVYRDVRRRLAGRRGLSARRRRRLYTQLLNPVGYTLEYLHETLRDVNRSAYALIAALIVVFVANALALLVFTGLSRQIVLGANLVALAVIGAIWFVHYTRLRHHNHSLHMHSAIGGN